MLTRVADTVTDALSGVSPYTREDAWALAATLSPRARIRVASAAADGTVLNSYDTLWPLTGPAPETTWAMLLAGDDQRFRWLVFDFDASQGNAVRDSQRMSYWLDELRVPHLVCVSGPSGGRHIWVRLGDPADAKIIRQVAELSRSLLPSLDIKPLTNPVAGCVRPPYAPHRNGGQSTPIGDLGPILHQCAGEEFLDELISMLYELGAEVKVAKTAPVKGVVDDEDGYPRLRGTKRELSMKMADALYGPHGPDASKTMFVALTACARARWAFRDILAIATTAGGLEYARSFKVGGHRERRHPQKMRRVLEQQWARAVNWVAANGDTTPADDAEYRERLTDVVSTVRRAQEVADRMPGLWQTHNRRVPGSHAQRAVLDALCLYMLQSARPVVEADMRRLGIDTGYSRMAVHAAITALAAGGWIERVGVACGKNGQRYRLAEKFSTGEYLHERTQAQMRAVPLQPTTYQQQMLSALSTKLELLRHDVFCSPGSLGRISGLVYRELADDGSVTVGELARAVGAEPHIVRDRLRRLVEAGLVERTAGGWQRRDRTARDFAARALGVDGFLQRRAERYEFERLIWAWWLKELEWMNTKGKPRRGKRDANAGLFKNPLGKMPPFPRGPDKKASWWRAARMASAGYLDDLLGDVAA